METFRDEVAEEFRFLVSEYGFTGPVIDDARAEYARRSLTIMITFDIRARMVETELAADDPERGRVRVGLGRLVIAAERGGAQRAPYGGRTRHEVKHSLAMQAAVLHEILPAIVGPFGMALLRKAQAVWSDQVPPRGTA